MTAKLKKTSGEGQGMPRSGISHFVKSIGQKCAFKFPSEVFSATVSGGRGWNFYYPPNFALTTIFSTIQQQRAE
jgi:hypothetical protein